MTDTNDAPPDDERKPLPGVPGHLQDAVQQLVRTPPSQEPKRPKNRRKRATNRSDSQCPATPSN